MAEDNVNVHHDPAGEIVHDKTNSTQSKITIEKTSKIQFTKRKQLSKEAQTEHNKKKNSRGRHFARKLPDRWLQYNPVGRDIPGTRIVAFKTPLDAIYFSETSHDGRFEIQHLLQYAGEAGKTFGLIVDLTDTERYYKSSVWKENDIEYVKIRCPGHEISHKEQLIKKFIDIVRNYLMRNVGNEKIVGVHCTHGLNRTGYLICRYLMECLNWSASKAIKEFELYRGYKIERKAYITSLYEIEAKLEDLQITSMVNTSHSI